MTKLSRREAVTRVGLLMGGVLSAQALSLLSGCKAEKKDAIEASEVFVVGQLEMITAICGLTIPTTATPGAVEAGVPEFVSESIADCYPYEQIQNFKNGLYAIDKEARERYDNHFIELSEVDQLAFLTRLEKEGKYALEALPAHTALHILKELTLVGYFTSEIGATQALQYEQIPGGYDGCIDIAPDYKSWAT